jgi:ASC-1-like (ASCH) protein
MEQIDNYEKKYAKYKLKYLSLKYLSLKYLSLKNLSGGNPKNYDITVKNPWFNYIKEGKKTVEGRLNKGMFSKLKIGDVINWLHITKNKKKLICKTTITSITKYSSFREMLEMETLENVLPNISSIDEGVKIYHQYYTLDDENKFGVIAITLNL